MNPKTSAAKTRPPRTTSATTTLAPTTRRLDKPDAAPTRFAGGAVRVSQPPLDRMLARGQLDDDPGRARGLFAAGDRLREIARRAALGGLVVVDLAAPRAGTGSGRALVTDTVAAARTALSRARALVPDHDWFVVEAIVIREQTLEETGRQCGTGNVQGANAVALDRLRRGLTTLAASWGLLPI